MDTLTFWDGKWHEGNPPVIGIKDHAMWLASTVFDGARAFDRCVPDLDRHCQRVITSAERMGLAPMVDADTITGLSREAIKRFPPDAELYVRPMYWAKDGFIYPDPASTQFALTVYVSPLPSEPNFSATMARTIRRPRPDMAPTDLKGAALYPNSARGLREIEARGFRNGVVLDADNNVAEFLTANLFMVRDGVAITPVPNGSFLNGITRQRVIKLLREDGVKVEERIIAPKELETADEIFSTGNYGKVQQVTRFEERDMQPGPVGHRARELYWEFAAQNRL